MQTVLVVEDDQVVRELIALSLERAGYSAVQAFGFEEAVKLFSENRDEIFAAIIDYVLVGPDGMEVARELLAQNRSLIIVFTSALFPQHVDFGNFSLVDKPLTQQKILDALRKAQAAG